MRWLALALCVAAVTAHAQVGPGTDIGQSIYDRGVGDGGVAVRAATDALELTGPAARCTNCHGHPLDGGGEGGVPAPALDWARLAAATVQRGGYGDASFAAAVRTGIGPDGTALHRLMPRYRLSDGEVAALIAYLKRPNPLPGVDADSITVATILPANPELRPMGERAARAVARQIGANDESYYGRRIRHRVLDASQPLAELVAALDAGPPLLVIASVGLSESGALADALAERGIVNFAPFAALVGTESAERIVPLRPGLRDQGIALARRMGEVYGCTRILAADDAISARTAEALGQLVDSAEDCPAVLLIAAPSLVEPTLRKAHTPATARYYLMAEQIGPKLMALAQACPLTVATIAPVAMAEPVEANAAAAVAALRLALARTGRDISPQRLRTALTRSVERHPPALIDVDEVAACHSPGGSDRSVKIP